MEWTFTIRDNSLKNCAWPGLLRKKYLLMFAASTIYGDDLNDDQTLCYKINKRSQIFEAYAVALSGYGLQHAGLTLKNSELPQKIQQHQGQACYYSGPQDVRRFFGTVDHLTYNYNHPRLIAQLETEPTAVQLRTIGCLFKSMNSMYQKQFNADKLKIIWVGGKVPQVLSEESGLEVLPMPVESKASNGHPDFADNDKIVDYFFSVKVIE